MAHRHTSQTRGWLRTPSGWVLLGVLAIAAFFLSTEHRAHVLGALPYVLLLLCPVLHLLLYRGHGGGHNSHREHQGRFQGRAAPPPGAELVHFPRSYLLANPDLAAWHTFGMEWKEHVSWLSPILATNKEESMRRIALVGAILIVLSFA